jgi:hypothetical protein
MKGVVIHALLAAFGLVFAYQTYTRKPEAISLPGGVTVAECSRDAITKLVLNTGTVEVVADPVKDGSETTFWITTRHRAPDEVVALDPTKNPRHNPPTVKPAAASAAAAGSGASLEGAAGAAADSGDAKPGAAEGETKDAPKKKDDKELADANKPKRFLASSTFDGYLKRLTPVRALRSLGKLDAKQDTDFGYGKTVGFLELECGGRSIELQSGARAFGSSQRYMRDTKTGVTYLFDEPTVSDLESAQFKFMQADLHAWKPEDIEEAVIEAQGAKKKLIHRDRKLPQAQWVDDASPAKRNELYANWFSRLSRLRARAYLERGSEPGSDLKSAGSATSVLRIDYNVADARKGTLELVRVDENGVGHYYARTETTKAWVALFDSAAKDVEQDVGMVVGVEQPDAPASQNKRSGASDAKGAKPEGARAPRGPHSAPEEFLPTGHPRVPAGH